MQPTTNNWFTTLGLKAGPPTPYVQPVEPDVTVTDYELWVEEVAIPILQAQPKVQ